jgi:hypothetical protein
MWRGPLFVAQKSQLEILIVVTETASRVPELRCCGGNPPFRIQTWPRFGGGLFFASSIEASFLDVFCPVLDSQIVSYLSQPPMKAMSPAMMVAIAVMA